MVLLDIMTDDTAIHGVDALQKISGKFAWRLLIDFASVFILIRFIYYKIYKSTELFFTFFIFNLVIFLIAFMLNKVDLSMGAAFGLFAVFSMLRYRTEDISIKDMTYLFLVIALGLMSAVTKIKDTSDALEYLFLGGVNATILLITYFLESSTLMRKEGTKIVIYENVELIKEGRHNELIADLSLRTGVTVHRYSIQRVDFLRDSVQIKIHFFEK